jgi:hypothetical protein
MELLVKSEKKQMVLQIYYKMLGKLKILKSPVYLVVRSQSRHITSAVARGVEYQWKGYLIIWKDVGCLSQFIVMSRRSNYHKISPPSL